MRLLRNRSSGMYFVGLEEDDQESLMRMITPEGKIKSLERHLFETVEPLAVAPLTSQQRAKYRQITGKSIPDH
jgi:hypothetical protein